ncbi:hypothetical protein, partial [Kingella kingae]|uniref:hypothetical protein n=1 Tax=Kingella kingae TaxID=504 RepID=UPI001E2B01E7
LSNIWRVLSRSFNKFADVVDKLAANLKSKGWVVLFMEPRPNTAVPALTHAAMGRRKIGIF